MPPQIVILGAVLFFLASLAYIRDTIRGKTKPNRVTWLMWSLAPLIGVSISWAHGTTFWEGLPVLMTGVMPLLIFLVTFINKNSYWKLTIFDYICGALSVIALIAWLLADAPIVALFLAIIGDLTAGLPTIRKSWLEPSSEMPVIYMFSSLDMLLGLLIISDWTILNSGFLFAVLLQNIIIITLVVSKIGPRLRSN